MNSQEESQPSQLGSTPTLNGGNSLASSYNFPNGLPNGMPISVNGVQWPPTPAEPPKTPEKMKTPSHNRNSRAPSPVPSMDDFFGLDKMRARTLPARTPGPHEHGPGPRCRASARIRSYAEDVRAQQFPRISRPVELMQTSYDCVVIGSGYGGAVAASRMARAGEAVCVLELGKERWPGEYPEGTREAFGELHTSGQFAPGFLRGTQVQSGDPTGMYHLIFGKGQNAIVCNGLGGTSLMNANVFLRADKESMAQKVWPEELRREGALNEYYDKVEKVLEPEKYPDDWPKLPKTEVLKEQAAYLGLEDKFYKVPQTTRFRNGPNSCGVEMKPSNLTGQDCTGLNDGSKTTTLVTYLADAWNWGAEMFCECEVRHIEEVKDKRGGYIIYFAWHGRNRGHFKANLHGDLMWVHAKKAVFLGAGAIGSTEILLRSKALGLGMSDQVGQNMSGNGDILAFGYNTDKTVNSIGRAYPDPYKPVGPCITGIIDNREGHRNPLDGYVIQEGTVPQALSRFFQAMLDFMPGNQGPEGDTIVERTQASLARWGSRLLGPYFSGGAIERTQVYLIMSHDSNQAVLTLEDDKPVLEFMGVARSDHVKRLNKLLADATQAVGGTLVNNPFFALMGQQVTVHPIGGAAMARDGTGMTGATNHEGCVFKGNGEQIYPNLIVTDGAVIPAALGCNPLATIAALAERSVEAYAKKRELQISTESNGILDLFGQPAHAPLRHRTPEYRAYEKAEQAAEVESIDTALGIITGARKAQAGGFGFTEVMSGYIHNDPGMKADKKEIYEIAYRTAKNLCQNARFFLSVQSFDTKAFVNDPDHKGMLTGSFVCPVIPGSPFMVKRGEFNLFVLDLKAPGTKNLTYDFDMKGINGKTLHFHGYKVVDSSVALAPINFWRATATLYVTISERLPRNLEDPDDPEPWRKGTVIAKGIMHIQPMDFMSQIFTMTPTGSSLLKKAASAANFLTYFTRKSLGLFLTPIVPLQYPSQVYTGYINNTLPKDTFNIRARDGVVTRLHVWEPTYTPKNKDGTPVETKLLFMIPGASVDHQIYALPTIPFNAVNYFCRAGYRVCILVHRFGQLMIAENDWTTYDARLDIRAAYEFMRSHFNYEERIYTIAHCMGSVALAAGLLDKTIPAEWILGITASQVFMHPLWNTLNMAKVMCDVPLPLDRMYKLLAGHWFSCSTSPDDSFVQRCINQLLRLYPHGNRREMCASAACHRTSFVFGRLWNHGNLNEATHRQIDRFFGGVNMRLLQLLMKQGSQGQILTNGPLFNNLTTPENIANLKGIPFMLFTGRDNAVLTPESTERTYEALCNTFGADGGAGPHSPIMYRRRLIPGYGHLDCWMGRNAWKDVYPLVREEVDRVVHGEEYRFREPSAWECKFTKMIEEGEMLY